MHTTAAIAPPAESHRKVSRNSWLMYPITNLLTVRARVDVDDHARPTTGYGPKSVPAPGQPPTRGSRASAQP